MFITFEGGEGTGKSTQIIQLAERLRQAGKTVTVTREPGGSPPGEKIREILVTGQGGALSAASELLLMTAARVEHVRQVIRPALARGEWLLCDRFFDSTAAYQGFGRGLDLARVTELHQWLLDGLLPDLTFLLDLDPQIGLTRSCRPGNRETRFEAESLAFHQRVRQGFLALAAAAPQRFRCLDAGQTPEALSRHIWEIVVDAVPLLR